MAHGPTPLPASAQCAPASVLGGAAPHQPPWVHPLVALKQVLAEEHAAPRRRDGTRDRSYLPWHAEDVWPG